MKTNKIFGPLLAFLCVICFVRCSDDDQRDKVTNIKMYVSAETGIYEPWRSDRIVEGMKIKEEGDKEYTTLPLSGIDQFTYERGHEYELLVEKTILANPPADASNVVYKLIEIILKNPVLVESEADVYTVEVVYAVDAEQKELIENDLQSNPPIPAGCKYALKFSDAAIVAPRLGECIIADSNNTPITSGTIFVEEYKGFDDMPIAPASYALLPPENQICYYLKWVLTFDGVEYPYDVYMVKDGIQIVSTLHPRLYEDLTEYYKTKYPNAGVKGVVRAQILTYKKKSI